jgi:AAA ATPase containing von Willebrand factor type A (vWA) domain
MLMDELSWECGNVCNVNGYRNEINRLETKKPGPRERRCVDSLIEANNANESDSNESNSPANDEDEDSDAVVGEVDDDRLDDDEDDDDDDINEQADDSSKNPIILFRKLLNTVQVKKKLEGITNSDQKSDEGNSNEEENEQVVTPTKIVNGRPVSGSFFIILIL